MADGGLKNVLRHLRRSALVGAEFGLTDGELVEHFVARREEAAFEELLRRHGPIVWGVCRRVLGNEADAADAFQATFLVLVRKAASLRDKGRVGNWLYGVARHTARKAQAMSRTRSAKERQAAAAPKRAPAEGASELLDAELGRLPDKYRAAIVLCDLEGLTIREAARHLGRPQGTVASQRARGHALLARRLSRHGLTLSGAALAGVFSQAAAGVQPPLAASVVKAALFATPGQAVTAGVVPANVAALTEGVLRAMFLTKLKAVTAVLLTAALVTAVAAAVTRGTGAPRHEGPPPAATGLLLADEAPKKGDPEKIQGTWKLVAVVESGRKATAEEIKGYRWVITKDKIQFNRGRAKRGGRETAYKLDAGKKPKWIDKGEGERTSLGIYELKGDDLKICITQVRGGKRPTAFESKAKSGDYLVVLKRE